MGSYDLRKIQFGLEVTKGTAVTTAKLMTGLDGVIDDTSKFYNAATNYNTGNLPGGTSGTPVFVSDLFEIPITGDFTYENGPYLLNLAWNKVAGTFSATGWTGVFSAPTSAANNFQSMTIQQGDDTEQLKGAYAIAESFELKGAANDVVKWSSKLMGRSLSATTTFDAATALPATPMPTNLFKLFVDPVSGTGGTTPVLGALREFTLKAKTGFHQKQFFDGVLYPTSHGQKQPEVKLDITFEYNATATGARSDWKNKLQKRIRIATGVTSAAPYFGIDVAGYWEKIPGIQNKDGNTTVVGQFASTPAGTGTYDFCTFTLMALSALTGGL